MAAHFQVAIVLRMKELLKYLYQQEVSSHLGSRDIQNKYKKAPGRTGGFTEVVYEKDL